ncbi:chaperonin 10-like protein [Syncephalastrum racemosum]|uniref:Chaperonin 10-like protein n=1 Tax=Syncephalastrum racemosum TaxID=13706 RepID=A0A1X2HMN0_SYNRA|nr:chaperonin 10-like protein [Syncephalastrum racemosum]
MGGYKIKALASTDKLGKFTETTYDAPPLKDDEVYIEIEACGVCHTDMIYMQQPNSVLGHEPIGRVKELGKGVTKFKVGDLVGFSYLRDACLECRQCISGQDVMCEKRVMFPEGGNNGFAEGVVCKSGFVYAVPEGLSAEEAAPLMCAGVTVFTALYQAKLPPTAHVAVVGIGGLGHLALQFARAWGFHVTAISHSPNKKEECLKFGAHEFLSSKDFEKTEYKGRKFDLILDTVSVDLPWDSYLDLLDRNGSFFLIGLPNGPIEIKQIIPFLQSQRVFKGSILGGRYMVELMLEFAARHQIKPAIVNFPFSVEGLEKAVEESEANKLRYRAVLTRN